MTTSSPSRAPWHHLIIFAATGALLWLFFRNVNLAAAWRAVTHANALLILAAIGMTFVTYTLRARRWQVLLKPVGHARYSVVLRMTVIGFMGNFLLPARAGEVLRAFLLAQREGLSAPSTFATVIVERLLDTVTVLLLFAVSLPLLGVDVGRDVEIAGILAGAGSVVALVVLVLVAGHPERLGRWAGKLDPWLPARLAGAVGQLVRTFAEGFAVMRRPSQLAAAMLWSIPVWLSIAVGILLTSHAFDLTMSFVGSFLLVGYLAVGVSVPTPGGTGGFHYFYLIAMTRFFGADPDAAAAAAIILHAVSFVPVTIVGLVLMWQDGLTLGRLKGMRAEAQAAERPPTPTNGSRINGTGL